MQKYYYSACKKKDASWMALAKQSILKSLTNDSIFVMKNSSLFPVMKNSSIALPDLCKLYNYVELKQTGAREIF